MMEIWSKLEVLNLKCNRSPLDNANSVEHFNWFLFSALFAYLLNRAEDGQFNEIKRQRFDFSCRCLFNLEQMIDWQHANRWERFSFPIPMSIIKWNIVRRCVLRKEAVTQTFWKVSVFYGFEMWTKKKHFHLDRLIFPSVFVFRLG